MHKTNCMQSIENISIWEVFSSICPECSDIKPHLMKHTPMFSIRVLFEIPVYYTPTIL